MVALRDGGRPSRIGLLAARLCVAGPLALIAGCASEKSPSYVSGPMGHQVAQAQAPTHKVEMEDDGEPVQPAPLRRMRPEEDDPSQPWSPNYGKDGAATMPPSTPNPRLPRQVDAAVAEPSKRIIWTAPRFDDPQLASTGALTQLSRAEADTIVAQAISTQEMRGQ